MRIDPKTAAAYAAGAFLFLLIFGVGWPGPGTWLLIFSLLLIAVAAAAWWLDGAMVAQPSGSAVMAGRGGGTPFVARGRSGRGTGRRGDSFLLSLGFPGPDATGRWVLPDRVHLTALAGAVGLLALIIFVTGAVTGGGGDTAETPTPQTAKAIDFADVGATGQAVRDAAAAPAPASPTGSGPSTDLPSLTRPGITQPPPQANTAPIVVETPTAPEPAPARALDAPSTLPTAEESVVHEVVAGDTIYDLAITYGSSIEAILTANGLNEFDTIVVGDRLIVPGVENSGSTE